MLRLIKIKLQDLDEDKVTIFSLFVTFNLTAIRQMASAFRECD